MLIGIICNRIHCYMRYSPCVCCIFDIGKIFFNFSQCRKYKNHGWCIGLKNHLFYHFQLFPFLISMYPVVSNLVNKSCLYLSHPCYVLLVNQQFNFNVDHKKQAVHHKLLKSKVNT